MCSSPKTTNRPGADNTASSGYAMITTTTGASICVPRLYFRRFGLRYSFALQGLHGRHLLLFSRLYQLPVMINGSFVANRFCAESLNGSFVIGLNSLSTPKAPHTLRSPFDKPPCFLLQPLRMQAALSFLYQYLWRF